MALRAKIVDFVGLCFLNDAHEVAGVGQITVVQLEMGILDVRVLVDMIDALGVEQTRPALDAMHNVSFFQEQFGQISAILTCDTSNEGNFWLGRSHFFSLHR